MNSRPSGSDLEIIDERVMLTLKRKEGEELRFRFVRARKPDGTETAWHDLRHWSRGHAGQWRPTQKGISIRTSELRPLLETLTRATAGGGAPAAQQELLPHQIYDRRAGRDPR